MIARDPYLSIVIPVYNEERRLSPCLEKIIPFVSRYYSHEIIVVDNGSTDGTRSIARIYERTYQHVRYICLPTRGKGAAVRMGMLAAAGKHRYMCDVDLSTPIQELPKFIDLARKFDVVVGSRELTPALVHTTWKRRMIGRIFHSLVSGIVPNIYDTQCGFKLFRDYAARAIFGRLKLNGLAFDVEALYLARLFDFRIGEMPVRWQHDPDTRIRLWADSLDMARDVLSIPMLHKRIKIPA